VIEPSHAAETARGKRVLVREDEKGQVIIEHKGKRLATHAFPKDSRVRQGAIVDNKHLAHVLTVIQARQRKRDATTLRNRRLTLRAEDLMLKKMGEAGLPHRRRGQKARSDHESAGIVDVDSHADRLGEALAWMEQRRQEKTSAVDDD
jgi:hypothetical protein